VPQLPEVRASDEQPGAGDPGACDQEGTQLPEQHGAGEPGAVECTGMQHLILHCFNHFFISKMLLI
jgi:hypothetical protein